MTASPARTSSPRSTPRRVWVLVAVLAIAAASAGMTARAFLRIPPLGSPAVVATAPGSAPGPAISDVLGEGGGPGNDEPGLPEARVALPAPPSAAPAAEFTVPILLYHYVRTNPEVHGAAGWDLSVAPEAFAQQMAYAHSAGIHTVSIADVMRAMSGGPPLPPHAVVLTFDDGYADFATTAAPILEREHLIATDYVVGGFMGRPNYMTADQVREVAAHGMVIGAHTMHHVALSKISPDISALEITQSKATLEQLLGRAVADFAYPYGDYDATVVGQVVAAGFRDAVTTDSGTAQSLPMRFLLRRIRVGASDSLASFARKAMLPPPPPTAETVAVPLPSMVPPSPEAVAPPTPLPPEPSTLIVPMPPRAVAPSPHPGIP